MLPPPPPLCSVLLTPPLLSFLLALGRAQTLLLQRSLDLVGSLLTLTLPLLSFLLLALCRAQTLLLQRSLDLVGAAGGEPQPQQKGPLLSYGPCQFPTLGFVVQRCWEVAAHTREAFWSIRMQHGRPPVEFAWARGRLFDRDAAEVLFGGVADAREAVVADVSGSAATCAPRAGWKLGKKNVGGVEEGWGLFSLSFHVVRPSHCPLSLPPAMATWRRLFSLCLPLQPRSPFPPPPASLAAARTRPRRSTRSSCRSGSRAGRGCRPRRRSRSPRRANRMRRCRRRPGCSPFQTSLILPVPFASAVDTNKWYTTPRAQNTTINNIIIGQELYQSGFVSYPRTETDSFDQGFDLRAMVAEQQPDQASAPFFLTSLFLFRVLSLPFCARLPRCLLRIPRGAFRRSGALTPRG